jgi:hypothetical protein
LKNLRNGKPGGVDGITAKILKEDIETTTKHLEKSFNIIWEKEFYHQTGTKDQYSKYQKKTEPYVTITEVLPYSQYQVKSSPRSI